jgi:hypothetical protein
LATSSISNTKHLFDGRCPLLTDALIALIAGILILVMPRLLNYIVAFYLIIIGLVGLFGGGANFTL